MKKSFILIFFILSGCLARPYVSKPDNETHQTQNKIIEAEIVKKALTGDWLVTRGYHVTDNLVANATAVPISHAAVFNSELKTVIEAEGKGIHFSDLYDFIDKSHRIILIRPRWRTCENSEEAWKNAEALVGRSYDFTGTVGFDNPKKYYCSELAVSIYKKWFTGREKFPGVIKPGELYLFGTIIYDSLPRDECPDNYSD